MRNVPIKKQGDGEKCTDPNIFPTVFHVGQQLENGGKEGRDDEERKPLVEDMDRYHGHIGEVMTQVITQGKHHTIFK